MKRRFDVEGVEPEIEMFGIMLRRDKLRYPALRYLYHFLIQVEKGQKYSNRFSILQFSI